MATETDQTSPLMGQNCTLTFLSEMWSNLSLTFSWLAKMKSFLLWLIHIPQVRCEEEKCQEWKSAFLQMDVKRIRVSHLLAVKNFLTFIPRAAFWAHMLIASNAIPHSYTFTHNHSRELLSTTTAYDCGLLCSSSTSSWGSRASRRWLLRGRLAF